VGLIYLDSCLLIYFVEERSTLDKAVASSMAESGGRHFAISPLVKCECLVGPLRRRDRLLEQLYREVFLQFESLDLPEAVYLRAAELRARAKLKTPDALHLACAQHHRCEALWTNDDRLNEASQGLAQAILR
jgi:predicted nucleic acid-binding protein